MLSVQLTLLFLGGGDHLITLVMAKAVSSNLPAFANQMKTGYPSADFAEHFDGDVFSSLRSSGLTCRLCIVVDDSFRSNYGSDKLKVLKKLEKLVDAISWNWRLIDWNNDKFPDNIGFQIYRVGWNPYPGEDLKDYNITRPAMSLLSELGMVDFGDCCLGLGFTMRPFQDKRVGIAFTASKTLLGGICDYRPPRDRLTSTNIILITGAGVDGYPLRSTDIEQVLLHELGHAFGVREHDNDILLNGGLTNTFRECSGYPMSYIKDYSYGIEYFLNVEPPGGRFLMWGENQQGKTSLKVNNLQFSSCSKRAVAEILKSRRGICFVEDEKPYCGNGIVEYGEDCDCGSEMNCQLMSCCGSRRSKAPCKKLPSQMLNMTRSCPSKFVYPFSVVLGDTIYGNVKSKTKSGLSGHARSSNIGFLISLFCCAACSNLVAS